MKTTSFLITFFAILLLLAPRYSPAQKIQKGCSFTGIESDKDYVLKNPSPEIRKIVDDILNEMSISRGNFLLYESNVNNAMAVTSNGSRYILYNQSFLEKFKRDSATQNAAYAILAHEIGHHFHGHEFDEKNSPKSKQNELEADYFAGGVLFSLCRTKHDAEAAYNSLPEKASKTHPSRENRIFSITEGWEERKKLKGVNPCNQFSEFDPAPLKIRGNRAENVQGEINRYQIIYTYDVKGDKPFKPYLYIKSGVLMEPKNIEWKDKGSNNRIGRQVVWHYTKDKYSYNMVNKKDWIGLIALPEGMDTKPPKAITYIAWGGVALAGVGGIVAGIIMNNDANDEYEVYENNLIPGQLPYTADKTRWDYYSNANRKHNTAEYLKYGGIGVTAVAGYFLVRKIVNRPPALNLYCSADGKPQLLLEAMCNIRNDAYATGIRLRF
ncbi:MAG: hypothetical protein DYG98_20765 [Haliscomenobacteraceae bacterium CHB4]|nr:hypothetical protein [Saprospiraceae bacterium]MCE7925493.1 hypothetical protein [Haliscomenobacteraceae bacterium CHB4]